MGTLRQQYEEMLNDLTAKKYQKGYLNNEDDDIYEFLEDELNKMDEVGYYD